MTSARLFLLELVGALEEDASLASRLARVLAPASVVTRGDDRIPIGAVHEHGAPSTRWVREQRRLGRIRIQGPRGAQYVCRAELEALLASTSIRRASRVLAEPTIDTTLDQDVRGAVLEMATARRRRHHG